MSHTIKTLPVATFQEILATGNLTLLGKGTHSQLEKAWERIFNEFIAEFGLSESYKNYIKHMLKAVQCYDKAYNKGQMWQLTIAEVEKAKAKAELGESTGNGFMLLVAQVSKGMGFRVDHKEVTVLEFYSYLKVLENGSGKG